MIRALRRPRFLAEWLGAGALALAVAAAALWSGALDRADALFYDTAIRRDGAPPPADTLIVAIDNRSLAEIGRFPWPRDVHAALIDRLAAGRPAAITYDVLFVEPSAPAADAALAGAIRRAGRVHLPLVVDAPGDNGAPFRIVPPIPEIRAAAAGVGHAVLSFDPDGIVRRVALASDFGGAALPNLAQLGVEPAATGVRLIPFAGPPGHIPTLSAAAVLRGEAPPELLAGKRIFVGATAAGLGDSYPTPVGGESQLMPGVEILANVATALADGRSIAPAPPGAALLLAAAPLAILLVGFLRLGPRTNLALGAALVLLTVAASAALLFWARVWVAPSAALLALVVIHPLWGWRRLAAADAFLRGELAALAAERGLVASGDDDEGVADSLGHRIATLRAGVRRLRDLRRFVDDALHGLPDATLVLGLDGRIAIANAEAAARFGAEPGADAGPLLAALGGVALADGFESEADGPAGTAYAVRVALCRDAGDAPFAWIVRLTDISAARAAQRQRETVRRLLTHDMRSPQASILALLQAPEAAGVDPELRRRLDGYARRTMRLADDFVQLARAEEAALPSDLVDLASLTVEAADDLWPVVKARGQRIDTSVPDDEALMTGDAELLGRALRNLLDNASKYSPEGSEIRAGVTVEDGRVVCRIADAGRGMSADEAGRLFQPFERFSGGDGAGLGLTFVQTVVQRHGGTIAVDSAPGAGTTFTLSFPQAAD